MKDKTLECYARELRDGSHPRALERIRATGAACGAERAEAFVAYRMAC
ncbi:hypothetical protein ACIGW7_18105 [Streptomyces sp. NPDC053253]